MTRLEQLLTAKEELMRFEARLEKCIADERKSSSGFDARNAFNDMNHQHNAAMKRAALDLKFALTDLR